MKDTILSVLRLIATPVLLMVLGVVTLSHPGDAMSFLCVMFGIPVLADGLFKIQVAVDARRFGIPQWWLVLLLAVLTGVIGLLLVLRPTEGAQVLVVPAAFNMTTGPAHWELLLRQRAVDNQCFTVGTSPARDERASYVAWGNSMVCDPWGTVLHQCGAGEEVAVTELDMTRIDAVRRQLPILSARRTDVYELRRL